MIGTTCYDIVSLLENAGLVRTTAATATGPSP